MRVECDQVCDKEVDSTSHIGDLAVSKAGVSTDGTALFLFHFTCSHLLVLAYLGLSVFSRSGSY